MVGLAISMHFQQFEYLKFLFFLREGGGGGEGGMPPDPQKTLAECPTVPN